MRVAGLACILTIGAGAALAQNTSVVVPSAPAIVATPIAPPAALIPQTATPPPGLVQSPLPPSDDANAPDGTAAPTATATPPDSDTGTPPDTDAGVPADSDTGAAAPPPDDGAIPPPADADNAAPGGSNGAPPPADSWLPGTTAELRVLNQVDGSVSQVQIPVGGQSQIGDMQVSVQSCLRRPPDQIPDAAVFLSAVPAPQAGDGNTDNDADATPAPDAAAPNGGTPQDQNAGDQPDLPAGYRGWLLRSAPGAAMAGDASESLSLIDCQ